MPKGGRHIFFSMEDFKVFDNGCIGEWKIVEGICEDRSGVYLRTVVHRNDAREGVIKFFDLQQILKDSDTLNDISEVRWHIQTEIQNLYRLDHPHIIDIYDACCHEDGAWVYFVMEYMKGGELFDYVISGEVEEEVARKFFRQLVSAVEYCHANFVVHRDLKLENIVLDESKRNIKIIDFGLSTTITPGRLLDANCGSLQYVAPEVLQGHGYIGPSSDIWSMGVILFSMIHMRLPFYKYNSGQEKVLNAALSSRFYVDSTVCGPYLTDLLYQLLDPDPLSRITIGEIRLHTWVNMGYIEEPLCSLPAYSGIDEYDPDIITKVCYFGFRPQHLLVELRSGSRCLEVAMYHVLLEQKRQSATEPLSSQVEASNGTSERRYEQDRRRELPKLLRRCFTGFRKLNLLKN